jgi:hypothetical protein
MSLVVMWTDGGGRHFLKCDRCGKKITDARKAYVGAHLGTCGDAEEKMIGVFCKGCNPKDIGFNESLDQFLFYLSFNLSFHLENGKKTAQLEHMMFGGTK